MGLLGANRVDRRPAASITSNSPGSTSRTKGGADDVQRRGLAGHDPATFEATQHQWPDPVRVARGVERVFIHEDEREGALDPWQFGQRGGFEALPRVRGQKCGDEVGVGGGRRRRLQRQFPESGACAATRSAISWVLVRLPLCANASMPLAVGRKVGWAFSQTLAPVVEYRQ